MARQTYAGSAGDGRAPRPAPTLANDMNAKVLVPWVLVLALLGGVYFLYSANRQKETELASLRTQGQELPSLRAELERIKSQGTDTQNEEIARLRQDNQEVLRLRNEKQQLTRELQAARSGVQQTERQMQQLQAQSQQAQQAAAQAQQSAQQAAQLNTCLNNLRQLDGAKQQWALEHRQLPNAMPTVEQVAAYLPNRTVPVCPAGGAYTLNVVSNAPSCSIHGYVTQ